jgi:hypothetical protein
LLFSSEKYVNIPLWLVTSGEKQKKYGNWLNGIDDKTKAEICLGVSALC